MKILHYQVLCSLLVGTLLPNDGQSFHNPVKEEMPTNRELSTIETNRSARLFL
jgi:hypothetical protein